MKVIAFSGGCVSGKTTTLNLVKERLEKVGTKVVTLNELMRDINILSIDVVRANPIHYLNIQNTIIREKIKQEMCIKLHVQECMLNERLNTGKSSEYVVLIDRAISDSIFYLLFYVDKSGLSLKHLKIYNELYEFADTYARHIFEHIYDHVIFFSPIEVPVVDKYRPKNIDVLKHTESRFIRTLTDYYCTKDKLDFIEMSDSNRLEDSVNLILGYIYNTN